MIRCIDKACDDGSPEDDETRPRWATVGLFCRRCADKLERRLAEMPARAQQLRAVLGGAQSPKRDGSRQTKGSPPIPLNLAAHDHLALMQSTLASWARLVAEERTLRGPNVPDVEPLSAWLLGQHAWLVAQPWADDLADEVRDLARVADGLAGTRRRWHRLDAPCPACTARELGRWDGADEVQCASCGDAWPERDYPRLALVVADDLTFTAAEAAARLGLAPVAFRQRLRRANVARVGVVDGLARYRREDIDGMQEGTA